MPGGGFSTLTFYNSISKKMANEIYNDPNGIDTIIALKAESQIEAEAGTDEGDVKPEWLMANLCRVDAHTLSQALSKVPNYLTLEQAINFGHLNTLYAAIVDKCITERANNMRKAIVNIVLGD